MIRSTKIIFFGTPDFAVPALEAIVKADYQVVAVVTQSDKPVGRGLKMEAPAVKLSAQKLGLSVLQPDTLKTPATLEMFKSLNANLAVCVAYGKIIPKEILDIFPKGILNIHPSLLPKYRGPSPIQTAILNGDEETGVTIMLLDEETDHGKVVTQQKITFPLLAESYAAAHNPATEGGQALSEKLSKIGAQLLIDTLPEWLAGTIPAHTQEHTKATFTKMLEREDGRIDWHKPAEQIERMVRAYDIWPGTFTMWSGKRLKILRASLLHPTIGCASIATPGKVINADSTASNSPRLSASGGERGRNSVNFPPLLKGRLGGVLAVNCNPGSIILEMLQPEGKKEMSGEEFLRGYPAFVSSILT